jgi:serine/threonine protein kinase
LEVVSFLNLTLLTGAFGEVRMCVHRETGAQRAVKVLRKSHMDDEEKKMLFNEINILRELVRFAFTPGPPEHRQNVRVLRG